MQPSFTVSPVRRRPRRQLLSEVLRRPDGRRLTSLFTMVLLLAGIALLSYPVATDLYGRHRQIDLTEAFRDPAVEAAYAGCRIAVGDGLIRLRIPKLEVDVLVVEGTTTEALRAGPVTTRGARCRERRATWRSPGTARPSTVRSTTRTSLVRATP